MRPSTIVTATLALAANAAPTTFPILDLKDNLARAPDGLSDYFNLIASKVPAAKALSSLPTCDLSKARMPVGVDGLPAPDDGTKVRHVAVGRGTQNYTCDPSNESVAPKAAGAVATLFNASCLAALHPDVLSRMPAMAVHFKLEEDAQKLGPRAMAKSGLHYFTDGSTPHFDMDTPKETIAQVDCAKDGSSNAPATAAVGQHGEKAVAWLRLATKGGTTGDIKHVYRVDTAGGSPPATCKDMPAKFQVEYAAVYWFWQGSSRE
ncbi:hypothetical protein EsDP_00001587 [Epichloe bromicola]|uniref:Malate dehydrogenase n=1 Tax=Epichloe bromicola TaxID=79588 RepID=A0ABQ0CIA2_9HYPO